MINRRNGNLRECCQNSINKVLDKCNICGKDLKHYLLLRCKSPLNGQICKDFRDEWAQCSFCDGCGKEHTPECVKKEV